MRPRLLPTLAGYASGWLTPDVAAGLTLVAIAVPEQMATARLVGLPPVTGLYAFIAGSVTYAVLGTNPEMSVGADSTIAPVIATGVGAVTALGTPAYAGLVAAVAVAVGILLATAGGLRLGWIADFLPAPVVAALLTGIGIEIVLRQLPAVLGVPSRGTTPISTIRAVVDERAAMSGWPVLVAAGVLAMTVGAERIDRRVPGALIGVAASILAVGPLGLFGHRLRTVGAVSARIPSFGLSHLHWNDAPRLVAPALTVVFLCVVQIAATEQASRSRAGSRLDRDLVAVGAGSVLAGLAGGFAVNASPPRTTVVRTAGGRSQLAGIVAAAITVGVLAGGDVLRDLPDATLAGVLMYIGTRLFRLGELRRVARFDRAEAGVALITVGVVGFVGIEEGVIAAVVLALVLRTRLAARPRLVVLGREPGTDHWIPVDIGRSTEQVAGVLVVLPYAPLWYGDAAYVVERLEAAVAAARPPPDALVIDADAMSDIDYTASQRLIELAGRLRGRGVVTALARTSDLVRRQLGSSGLLGEIGPDHVYPSVQEAVTALTGEARPGGRPGAASDG